MIRAVLFDLDGTLYLQPRLRALMAGELLIVPWLQRAPWRVQRLWKVLRVFRHVREELRDLGRPAEALQQLQYSAAASRADVPVGEVELAVHEWMIRRPLKYLPHVVRSGTREAMSRLRESGREVGVFSDYPVREKLKAMGLEDLVSLTIDATEADVNAFKPHPRGFLMAAERWRLQPADILYVGDRPEVDALGAAAAGMRCAVFGASPAAPGHPPFVALAAMSELFPFVESDRSHS